MKSLWSEEIGALEQDYASAMRFEELAEPDCIRCGETQKK